MTGAKAVQGQGRRRAVFLDRDGTLIQERHYLADPDGIEIIPGAADALRALAVAGFALVLVTNQAGIARGLYTDVEFRAVQERLHQLLLTQGVRLDATYYCPHHPDFSGPCDCRKPAHGMYRRAQRDLGLDFARSAFVGDRLSDVLPGLQLGGLGILVRTGYGAEEASMLPDRAMQADDLMKAAELILNVLPGVPVGDHG